MKYLLDTRLLAELAVTKPGEWAANWFDNLDEDDICLSILTIGEIVKGIEKLEETERKPALYDWLHHDLLVRFHGRILPLDMEVIQEWGKLNALLETEGRAIGAVDGLIAATVRAKGLVLLTHDIEDFSGLGIQVSDPRQG